MARSHRCAPVPAQAAAFTVARSRYMHSPLLPAQIHWATLTVHGRPGLPTHCLPGVWQISDAWLPQLGNPLPWDINAFELCRLQMAGGTHTSCTSASARCWQKQGARQVQGSPHLVQASNLPHSTRVQTGLVAMCTDHCSLCRLRHTQCIATGAGFTEAGAHEAPTTATASRLSRQQPSQAMLQ